MEGIEHVVVLMLENRSFDHMLGLLDHPSPEFPRIRVDTDDYSNPADPTDAHSARVRASADADFELPVEPPHSHASVMEQLGVRFGRPHMDGFVAAYRRRVQDPTRDRPVIHWIRIALVAGVALILVAAAIAWGAVWSLVVTWLALWAVVGIVALIVRRKRRVLPKLDWGSLAAVALTVTFALAALAAAVGEQTDAWWAFGTLVIVLVAGGGAALVLGRKHVLAAPPPPPGTEPGAPIMRCMDPMQRLPALATLAKEFAVCTRWHCSVPGATWPNRNFAHAATSDGTVDIEIGFYEDDTIFDRLEDQRRSWHVYHDGIAQLIAFRRLWDDDRIANWFCFDDFANHVASDALPHYSFIEPCHTGPRSNSQHPGNNDFDSSPTAPGSRFDFERGDDLIASIYETLRAHPDVFAKTAFLVTYDEHGGLYDHVAPPRARSPKPLGRRERPSLAVRILSLFREQPSSRFRFRRYGPRVPAVVVSPRVVAATVDDTAYDHTSIPATVRALFAPGAEPLSRREAHAATFQHLMTGPLRTDLPDLGSIRRTAAPPTVTSEPQAAPPAPVPVGAPRDDFARQLDELATHLDRRLDQHPAAPPGGPGAGSGPDTPRAAVAPATTPGPDHTDRVAARFVHHAAARRAADPTRSSP